MKYELGDYVQISKRWKKTNNHPFKSEVDDDGYQEVIIRKKIDCNASGFIAGFRYGLKQIATFELNENDFINEMVEIESSSIDVYLVATRMNCLYEVSKEDIQLIKDVSEIY
ncbi:MULTISPECIES: hypothetical protein [unclassified Mammaliicoccus]|uniref:hypothetical protein n=1 Tax=unclassified Mammaliicoccus TaxID=2803851 RepID=UPI001EFB7C98|nr:MULTISPECIES: hypothetical protein [unclassified Mammaliicoccus]